MTGRTTEWELGGPSIAAGRCLIGILFFFFFGSYSLAVAQAAAVSLQSSIRLSASVVVDDSAFEPLYCLGDY